MSKLIDEYELKKKIYDFHKQDPYGNLCTNDLDAIILIEDAQEAVVRCKDCKHYRHEAGCADWCHNNDVDVMEVYPEFFCAAGERRTE